MTNEIRAFIAFCMFTVVIFFVFFLNITGFWALLALSLLLIIGSAVIVVYFPITRQYLGLACANLGANNNYRLGAIGAIALICLIFAIKYGTGEPLLLSTWRSSIQEYYSVDMQRNVNQVARGVNENDAELARRRQYFNQPAIKNAYPLKTEEEVGGTKAQYTERINNYVRYAVFASNADIQNHLNEACASFITTIPERVREKSWIFWKLFFWFLMLFILYIPFAFADEVADIFDQLIIRIRDMRDEIKAGGAQTNGAATVASKGKGLFTKLYASDMLSEFTLKLLSGATKLFRR